MTQIAKLFVNGRSQAVRLPAAFRFEGSEVFIRRDEKTGDVILSHKPTTWDAFVQMVGKNAAPEDFLSEEDRRQDEHQERDPFAEDGE